MGHHVLALNYHVLGRVELVVDDYHFSFHQLHPDVADRTRVIFERQVHF